MIKPEQIPDEVVEAAHRAALEADFNMRDQLRAAIAAAINTWPGIEIHTDGTEDWIELPLIQENNDD